jgi:N-acetylneuraminic acid mutarotase
MKKNVFVLKQFYIFLLIALFYFPLNSMAQMNTWVRKADMPTGKYFLAATAVNGKIYAMGGYNGPALSTVEEYDSATDTWMRKADMPEARYAFPCLAFDGKIYVFGGQVETYENGLYNYHNLSQIDVYDPNTDTWTKKGDMPSARAGMGVSVVNGKIYVVGGWDNNQYLSTTEEYDPVTGIWTKKADMPTPRGNHASPVIDEKIYVIGGWQNDGVSSSVEVYDPIIDIWVKKADMPNPRGSTVASVVNGKIYIIGGGSDKVLELVEEYDVLTDTWKRKADMLTPRTAIAACEVNGIIYVMGGRSKDYFYNAIVEAYDTGLGMEVKNISLQEGFITGGEAITIFGSGFLPNLIVTIGDKPISDLKVTDTIITGKTPPGTEGEQDIKFIVPEANYTGIAGKFYYKPVSKIVMTKMTPNNGKQAGGDTASITGSGFLPGATVAVDGNPGTGVVVTPTLITFRVPSGTEGTKDVVVTNPDGQRGILRNAYTYNPFPIIGGIEPPYGGPLSGGTEITIRGQNFMQGVTVYIGSERVLKLESFSSTELRLRTPAGTEGMKPIRVVNPDGQEAVKADGFSYNYPPSIFSIEPTSGALEGGTWVTITGTRFNVLRYNVYVGGIEAKIEFRSAESITIVTPPSTAGTKDVVLENADGQKDTLENAFTYNPAPVITGITPNNGKPSGGTKITIQGSGFMPEAKVFVGDVGQNDIVTIYAAVWSWEFISPTTMTALMPPGEIKTVSIVVVNPDDQKAILKDGFAYNPLPTITGIQPNNGPSSGGTKVLIKGSGFLPGAKVMVGFYDALSVVVKDEGTIEVITPPGQPGMNSVIVTNPDTQSVSEAKGFIYIGKKAYNYPNPFRASQGTTFRYVSKEKAESLEVRIFNTGGVPIDVVSGSGSNEVKWQNASLRNGIYVYVMEVVLEGGKKEHHKGVLEVF